MENTNVFSTIQQKLLELEFASNSLKVHWHLRYLTPGGVLPSKRLLGMCRWMGSHFHNWTDYNGITFSVE